jgi:predicted small metal-binding protein
MAVTIRCADLSGQCDGEFTTEGMDELLEHVALHAGKVHPDLELTPEVVEQAKSLVRTV